MTSTLSQVRTPMLCQHIWGKTNIIQLVQALGEVRTHRRIAVPRMEDQGDNNDRYEREYTRAEERLQQELCDLPVAADYSIPEWTPHVDLHLLRFLLDTQAENQQILRGMLQVHLRFSGIRIRSSDRHRNRTARNTQNDNQAQNSSYIIKIHFDTIFI